MSDSLKARLPFFGGGEHRTQRTPLKIAASRPLACGSCGLDRGCKTPRMKPYGRGRLGILVIGEAPGQTEDDRGRPFVGRAGSVLRDELLRAGCEMDTDCWVGNSAICRPAGNKLPPMAVQHCRPQALKMLEDFRPSCIILLGGSAVASLLGWLYREGLSNNDHSPTLWAGWQIPCRALDAWIVPTFHPSFVAQNESKVAPGSPEPSRVLFRKHISAAVALAKQGRPWGGKPPDPWAGVRCVTDPMEAANAVRRMTATALLSGGRLSIDLETDRLKPDHPEATIYCAAISDGTQSVAFPWTPPCAAAVKEMMLSPVKKTAYNLQFEAGWLYSKLGVPITTERFCFDAMIGTHTLDARPGTKGLEFQAFVRLGVDSYAAAVEPYMKSDDASMGDNARNRVHLIEKKLLLNYCAKDAMVEHMLSDVNSKRVGREL